jgi:hypothetical protein
MLKHVRFVASILQGSTLGLINGFHFLFEVCSIHV